MLVRVRGCATTRSVQQRLFLGMDGSHACRKRASWQPSLFAIDRLLAGAGRRVTCGGGGRRHRRSALRGPTDRARATRLIGRRGSGAVASRQRDSQHGRAGRNPQSCVFHGRDIAPGKAAQGMRRTAGLSKAHAVVRPAPCCVIAIRRPLKRNCGSHADWARVYRLLADEVCAICAPPLPSA